MYYQRLAGAVVLEAWLTFMCLLEVQGEKKGAFYPGIARVNASVTEVQERF